MAMVFKIAKLRCADEPAHYLVYCRFEMASGRRWHPFSIAHSPTRAGVDTFIALNGGTVECIDEMDTTHMDYDPNTYPEAKGER